MALELTVLGSGSGGNATLIALGNRPPRGASAGDPRGRVLIDAGFSLRETVRRLGLIGVALDSVRAIVLTHEHHDHTQGAARLSRQLNVPVYATRTTLGAWGIGAERLAGWQEIRPGAAFEVCGVRFDPFVVPHDAIETLAFTIGDGQVEVGFATDLGSVTATVIERFAACDALVLEANHARDLLRMGPYSRALKARIGGGSGHLSNEGLGAFIRDALGPRVRTLVLAHLSQVNNYGPIAEIACREALAARGRDDVRIVLTYQDRPSDTIAIGSDVGLQAGPGLGQLTMASLWNAPEGLDSLPATPKGREA